jgi:hypothetical protein
MLSRSALIYQSVIIFLELFFFENSGKRVAAHLKLEASWMLRQGRRSKYSEVRIQPASDLPFFVFSLNLRKPMPNATNSLSSILAFNT